MRSRRPAPPPEKATWADFYRIALGAIMIPLGIIILWRAYSTGNLSTAAILLGLAFIGYGAYRLYVGIVRYRMYKNVKDQESNAKREKS
jgi:uncharacterized membrane protein